MKLINYLARLCTAASHSQTTTVRGQQGAVFKHLYWPGKQARQTPESWLWCRRQSEGIPLAVHIRFSMKFSLAQSDSIVFSFVVASVRHNLACMLDYCCLCCHCCRPRIVPGTSARPNVSISGSFCRLKSVTSWGSPCPDIAVRELGTGSVRTGTGCRQSASLRHSGK